MQKMVMSLMVVAALAVSANAAVVSSTSHGASHTDLNGSVAVGDLISGQIGTQLPGDLGWHPANTAPADQLPTLTNDIGGIGGLEGLLNDFPGAGNPTKIVNYVLGGPKDVAKIQVMSGNAGKDGRVFSTTVVEYSTDNGANYSTLGYFQSDPSGTINSGQWGSTLVEIYDDASATLLSGVTDIKFLLFAVDNTGGQMRDPYDGVNPYTGADDTLTAAFVSPLIYELDVIEVPEPASLMLLGLGSFMFLRRRRA